MATTGFPVVIVTGPVGIGKTTTAGALGELLIEHDVAHTMVDLDALTWTYPRPLDDRFNARLGLRNLAAVARNAREIGSERLILAGVIESAADRDACRAAIPDADITVVRLIAPLERIHERIAARSAAGRRNEADVAWDHDRAAELIDIMDAAVDADLVIDTTDQTLQEVAMEIAIWLDWLP